MPRYDREGLDDIGPLWTYAPITIKYRDWRDVPENVFSIVVRSSALVMSDVTTADAS